MNNQPFQWGAWLRSKTGLVTLFFLAIAAFYFITEHTLHVYGVLPYLLILLCPLMHLFMHGRHGGHDTHTEHEPHSTQDYTRFERAGSTDHSHHMQAQFDDWEEIK